MKSYRGRLEVMVIEPEPYYRVSTTYFLSSMGYAVIECIHCLHAHGLIRKRRQLEEPLQLLIADLSEASLALVQSLRSEQVLTPVLFTTPCPDSEAIRCSMSLEASAVLLKPYSLDEMARVMAQLLYPELYGSGVSRAGQGSHR